MYIVSEDFLFKLERISSVYASWMVLKEDGCAAIMNKRIAGSHFRARFEIFYTGEENRIVLFQGHCRRDPSTQSIDTHIQIHAHKG